MLKVYGFIIRIFLIFIVFIRIPEDSAGLSSFPPKSGILNSPRSVRRFLDILTSLEIFLYLSLAFKLNLLTY